MKLTASILAYTFAMTLANLLVFTFGPAISPVNAFLLIGFDLTMRDRLQMTLSPLQMAALILASSVITFVLAPAAERIALASAVAFGAAALVDWTVFTSKWSGKTWLRRANTSNAFGAAVDSLIFPTLAFGSLMPHIVAAQFAAKIAGGAIWAWVFDRFSKRAAETSAA